MAADDSAVDEALKVINATIAVNTEGMNPWDFVEWQEQQPGYSAYVGRLRTFAEAAMPNGARDLAVHGWPLNNLPIMID